MTKEEYIPGELSAFYCVLSLGMAIEHIWLMCGELGLGIQFVSTPMEVPAAWEEIKTLLHVPADMELMALYRLGYLPDPTEKKRPRIDWTSSQRKRFSQLVFHNTAAPENSWPEDIEIRGWVQCWWRIYIRRPYSRILIRRWPQAVAD